MQYFLMEELILLPNTNLQVVHMVMDQLPIMIIQLPMLYQLMKTECKYMEKQVGKFTLRTIKVEMD